MSAVKALSVSGYKSIRELRDFPLTNLNVLIGANGAGKSNFISLFRLLNQMVEQNLQIYSQVQGGPDALLHFGRNTTKKLHAKFFFGRNGYAFNLIPTNDNRLLIQWESNSFDGDYGPHLESLGSGHEESKLKAATSSVAKYVQNSVSNWRVYHFQDTGDTANVKRVHASNINLRLLPDAGNLAAYLYMLRITHPREYQRIVETIRLVAPFFDDFVHRPNNPEYVELEWTQVGKPDMPFKAHYLSDGTLRFMCLATLLLQPTYRLPSTILIDEPELGLHPYAIHILASIFKQVAENRQLIISTQSVELVNELSPEDIIIVEQEDGASTFKRFKQDDLADWLEQYSLGELWKSNVLGGRP
jgi:predicted ATPase